MECRETLKLAHTKANIKYAERLRGEVLNAIERNVFDYAAVFPTSKMLPKFGVAPPEDVTVGALLREQAASARRTLAKSTADRYEQLCESLLIPKWGKMCVRDLTPALLRPWIAGMKIKARSIRQYLIPLRGALDQAVNDDLIEFNPLDRVKLRKVLDRDAHVVEFEADPFSAVEIAAVLAACKGQERTMFQFAFCTGMRPSEYMALEWSSVDIGAGMVGVDRALVAREVKDEAKTRAGIRKIDLRNGAMLALLSQMEITGEAGGRVFHDQRYDVGWTTGDVLSNRWRIILRKAKVRYRNLYQTRHTFASTLLSTGENMMYVAKQMGHTDTTMIVKTYGKWLEQVNGVLPEFFALVSPKNIEVIARPALTLHSTAEVEIIE